VPEKKAPPEMAPQPGVPERKQEVERERRALRDLIDSLRRQPQSSDDGGFYRNAGRIIVRPLMKPHWPGDKGR